MITYYLLYLCTGILNGLAATLYNLPDASLPASFTSALTNTGNYISIAFKFLPDTIAAIFTVITFIVVVENADGIFKVVKWIYTKIPGIS